MGAGYDGRGEWVNARTQWKGDSRLRGNDEGGGENDDPGLAYIDIGMGNRETRRSQ